MFFAIQQVRKYAFEIVIELPGILLVPTVDLFDDLILARSQIP